MRKIIKILIIIPCFNEEERLPISDFLNYIECNSEHNFLFVNDGSTDDTKGLLRALCQKSNRFKMLDLNNNSGKAEAIRQGMLYSTNLPYDYIGFLDADLAAPISEINNIASFINNDYSAFLLLGSRVKLLGSTNIKRSKKRHYLGRVFATIVGRMLNIGIYDTQCGAKLIKREVIETVFHEPFVSKWLFDVEILFRLRNSALNIDGKLIEVPLKNWEEKPGSKIKFTYFLKAPLDLLKIYWVYR